MRLDDHERPVRLDDEQPRGSLLNKCRIRSAAHSPTRCACAENKGRRAARRCQAQASIEKRVAAAPKSRPSYHRPPSASPASRKSPRSQLCPPANPPPDSDSPLSAARVTPTRSCDRRPATLPVALSQHQLLLIRPPCSHRRTATPLRTGPEPIGRRRPKTAGNQWEIRDIPLSLCIGPRQLEGEDHWAVEDHHPILRKPTASDRAASERARSTRPYTPSPAIAIAAHGQGARYLRWTPTCSPYLRAPASLPGSLPR